MSQMKIGFVGFDASDVLMYIARLFSTAGKRVAMVDCTELKTLLRLVTSDGCIQDNINYYKNILLLDGDLDYTEDIEQQDVVLYNIGYRSYAEELQDCTHVILVSEMAVQSVQLLNDMDMPEEASKLLLIRNHMHMKYGEKYLMTVLNEKFEEGNVYLLPYEEVDYKAKCYLCVDKKHKLSGLSTSMKNVLQGIYLQLQEDDITRKELLALFKRA